MEFCDTLGGLTAAYMLPCYVFDLIFSCLILRMNYTVQDLREQSATFWL